MLTDRKDELSNPHKKCIRTILDNLICHDNDIRRINIELRDQKEQFKQELDKIQFRCPDLNRPMLCVDAENLKAFSKKITNIDEVNQCFKTKIDSLEEQREEIFKNAKHCLLELNTEKCRFKQFHEKTMDYLKRLIINTDNREIIANCERDICQMQKFYVNEINSIKACERELQPLLAQLKEEDYNQFCSCCCFKDYDWLPKGKNYKVVQGTAEDIKNIMGTTLSKAFAQMHIRQVQDPRSFLAAYLMNLERNEEMLKEKLLLFGSMIAKDGEFDLDRAVRSGDTNLDEKIFLWFEWDRNQNTYEEMKDLVTKRQWRELGIRFRNPMAFGSVGPLGPMRAGNDSINDVVIIQLAQGLCEHTIKHYPNPKTLKEHGIVIGYDGRLNSKRFADLIACVFIQRKVKVYLFRDVVPTPFISFSVVQLKCLLGVMITGSHYPKEMNGCKIYWCNGTPVCPPHNEEIQEAIMANLVPKESSWNTQIVQNNKLIRDPYDKIFNAYFDKLATQISKAFIEINGESAIRFVYTDLHGVGSSFVEKAFNVLHLNVNFVPEQKYVDPIFPTVKIPDPRCEAHHPLSLAINEANLTNINFILANSPDGSNFVCAEKNEKSKDWKIFTSNEISALLGWWSIHNYKDIDREWDLSQCHVIGTILSSRLMMRMACIEGFRFDETLPEFRWMSKRAFELQKQNKNVLFVFDESYGFMFPNMARDNDGIAAACHFASMTCFIRNKFNRTVAQQLDEIYATYGYHCSKSSFFMGKDQSEIDAIFAHLRHFDGCPNTYPISILDGEFPIKSVRDLAAGVDTCEPDGKSKLATVSSLQLMTFTFTNGFVVSLCNSLTEPKIEYYAEIHSKPQEKNWHEKDATLERMIKAVVDDFIQPKDKNFISKKVYLKNLN